jgi:TPR repeat protein
VAGQKKTSFSLPVPDICITFATNYQTDNNMRTILTTLLLLICGAAMAQNADKLYEEGKALYDAKKYVQAIPKLRAAAEQGHKKAQYRLGRCYDKGNGVKEDDDKAFEWYFKSAERGFAKAQYQVGKSYKNGEGVEEDRVKAFQYFTKAAKQGNAKAQFALGECYFEGKGVAQDKAKAKACFLKALNDEKDGKEILEDLRKDAADGDEDAIAIKKFLGK